MSSYFCHKYNFQCHLVDGSNMEYLLMISVLTFLHGCSGGGRVIPLRTDNVPVNSKTAHPPGKNPRAFDFSEKFWSNSPLYCQFRRSNAPPVRASKRVKSPTLQGKLNRLPLEINRIAYNNNTTTLLFHIPITWFVRNVFNN